MCRWQMAECRCRRGDFRDEQAFCFCSGADCRLAWNSLLTTLCTPTVSAPRPTATPITSSPAILAKPESPRASSPLKVECFLRALGVRQLQPQPKIPRHGARKDAASCESILESSSTSLTPLKQSRQATVLILGGAAATQLPGLRFRTAFAEAPAKDEVLLPSRFSWSGRFC
jgi:hypothetical protein